MAYDLTKKFVVGIASRSLFDLSRENQLFDKYGPEPYAQHMVEHANQPLAKGTSFNLIKKFLDWNKFLPGERAVEVIVMSRNQPEAGLRICQSVKHHGLPITRYCFTGGSSVAQYLAAHSVNLFLSANSDDVGKAFLAGIPSALTYGIPSSAIESDDTQIRIAFDGDGVLFGDDAERVNQTKGLETFFQHETERAAIPLRKGPFAKLLLSLSYIQSKYLKDKELLRTALVTARNAPAESRVMHTLRSWKVRVDESFYLGGADKSKTLAAFAPDIFFDDQAIHCQRAACSVPTAQVASNLFTMSDSKTPLCPKCGAIMARRVASRGVRIGKPFWGCTNYGATGCTGLIPIA